MTTVHGMQLSGSLISAILLLLILFASMINVCTDFQSSTINYWPRVDVTIDVNKVMGINNLSLGFMLDFEWKSWCDSSVRRGLAQDANFKLIRVFDFRQTSPRLMPVIDWNESAKTGTFNWTNVDALVQAIFDIGAEPLFCLGWARTDPPITNYLPPGMSVNPATGLPYPESYAAYAVKWVKHFKTLGWPVRYYEIMNEPYFYFCTTPFDKKTKLANYVSLWNVVARRMRQETPNILISYDASTMKWVFDYWLLYGDDIDYLDLHKYDSHITREYTDTKMFDRGESEKFDTSPTFYGIEEACQKWFNARGKLLPVIISESNFNSAYEAGTDHRIQQVVGAVWLSLVLRKSVLSGVRYYVYYSFSSSASYRRESGGLGFGMVNSDNNEPWYPYCLQKMLSNNVDVGDCILQSVSSSDDVRSLSWIDKKTLNILLICKVDEPRAVYFAGITGHLTFSRIDSVISYLTPSIQTGIVGSSEPLKMDGYSVVLLQTRSSQ